MSDSTTISKVMERLREFSWEVRGWIKEGMPLVSQDEQAARIDRCCACEHFDPQKAICGKCGCLIIVKAWMKTANCPDSPSRWDMKEGQQAEPGWLFSDPVKAVRLIGVVESWMGTPFWAGTKGEAVKGVKADCVSFVAAVVREVGACSDLAIPPYVTHFGGPPMLQLLLNTLANVPNLKLVAMEPKGPPETMAGDLLVLSNHKGRHHLAIVSSGVIWHCTESGGVCRASLGDPMLLRALVAVYRFVK